MNLIGIAAVLTAIDDVWSLIALLVLLAATHIFGNNRPKGPQKRIGRKR